MKESLDYYLNKTDCHYLDMLHNVAVHFDSLVVHLESVGMVQFGTVVVHFETSLDSLDTVVGNHLCEVLNCLDKAVVHMGTPVAVYLNAIVVRLCNPFVVHSHLDKTVAVHSDWVEADQDKSSRALGYRNSGRLLPPVQQSDFGPLLCSTTSEQRKRRKKILWSNHLQHHLFQ